MDSIKGLMLKTKAAWDLSSISECLKKGGPPLAGCWSQLHKAVLELQIWPLQKTFSLCHCATRSKRSTTKKCPKNWMPDVFEVGKTADKNSWGLKQNPATTEQNSSWNGTKIQTELSWNLTGIQLNRITAHQPGISQVVGAADGSQWITWANFGVVLKGERW